MKTGTAVNQSSSTEPGCALLAERSQPHSAADDVIPLSFGQQRLWFLEQMEPGRPLYNIPYLVRLSGRLEVEPLRRALEAIVQRHESLRTRFELIGSRSVQVIGAAAGFDLPLSDLSDVVQIRREGELHRLARNEATRPFDLQRDLMLRARLFRLGETEHALLLVMHHIAADGWSMAVLYRELGALYDAFTQGRPSPLPELAIQYADFAVWQQQYLRGEALDRLLTFWKKQLAGAPALLELPTDRPRPPVQSYRGDVVTARFPAALAAALGDFCRQPRATIFMTLLAAFKALLHRYTNQEDIVVGSLVAARDRAETEGLIGFFVNTLVLRTDVSGDPTFTELLARVRDVALAAYDHQEIPFEKLVEELQPERNLSYSPLCQIVFALQNTPNAPLKLPGLTLSVSPIYTGTAKFDLTVWASEEPDGLSVSAEYNTDLFQADTVRRFLGHFQTLLEGVVANPDQRVSQLPLLTPVERKQLLVEWNCTHADYPQDKCVHRLFEEQAARTPEAVAVVFEDQQLTYLELNGRADQLAAKLRELGVGPDVLVGICVERSLEMLVGLLGILKAGGAYVPLDPAYPKERLAFMLADSRVPVIVTQQGLLADLPAHEAQVVLVDAPGYQSPIAHQTTLNHQPSTSLAYVLYTSGSTGKPKGVMVSHRNVLNFFAGMDKMLGGEPGVWLAVTSISFDISVLELFWALARGFKVVIASEQAKLLTAADTQNRTTDKPVEFSLFYFADEENQADKYRLLIEGAKFADRHGFRAVWTPERHFHSFGGLYPNPSVIGAAVAMVTQQVQIRAGSVVLPLHHPLRVAEEWSVVDNLSKGRVAVSFASGWHDRDFVLAPENYSNRKEIMLRHIDTVRKLWRGETVKVVGGDGNEVDAAVFPRPVQPELPIWITATGSTETIRLAGEQGANLLTGLLGLSLEQLAEKIEVYRAARRQRGFDEGCVTLMLHTFVGENLDEVREKARRPFCDYLIKFTGLLKGLSQEVFPGFDFKSLTADELEALAEHAFNRYFETSGLLGTPQTCLRLVERLKAIGVDEVACLIDFGVDADSVLASLSHLNRVREESQKRTTASASRFSLAEQIVRHRVTHLQCTPSMARMLVQSPDALRAIRPLRKLLVGGEALPGGLAERLCGALEGELLNVYGPTETTVWSTARKVDAGDSAAGIVPIGRPIANTRVYILDKNTLPVPINVPGELYIGGDSLARGYLNRPELTQEKFVPHPFESGVWLYRTGDLVRYRPDGNIEFLGRLDHQIKLRGHRIELGEIESVLGQHPAVRQSVAVVREDTPGDARLVAYVVARSDQAPSPAELREFLSQKLPDYMVPSAFVALEQLPLTPNGKVDRKALPAPECKREEIRTLVPPHNPLEEALAAIWREVLRVEQVSVDDNFFELGGHSLLAAQVVARVRTALHVELPVRSLFEAPTVAGQARIVAERQRVQSNGNGVKITRRARGEKTDKLLAKLDRFSEAEVESLLKETLAGRQTKS